MMHFIKNNEDLRGPVILGPGISVVQNSSGINILDAEGGGGAGEGSACGVITFNMYESSHDIATGRQAHAVVPDDCTITEVWLLSQQVPASVVVDLWAVDYAGFYTVSSAQSICAGNKITLVSGISKHDDVLTGWSKTLPSRTILIPNLDSVSGVNKGVLSLHVFVTYG